MTTGDFGFGITGQAGRTEGDIIITVTGGVITTAGSRARGINGIHGSSTGTGESGDVVIHATNADIRTTYDGSVGTDPPIGLLALNQTDGEGNVMVTLTDTNISTGGPGADAVFAQRLRGNGDVTITIQRGQITTNHYRAEGILGWHGGSEGATGDVRINLKDVTIETNGEQLVPSQSYTLSHGAFGYHTGDGDIIIDARSGTAISTNGAFSYGLRAFSAGTGNIQVTTHKGSSITNTGLSGHGIDARNTKADVMDDTRSITITVGGDITASGENAHGVRIGTGSSGFVGLDEDGYRRQTVTVNGRVTGGSGSGAGIYLSNGGKVIIGPRGSIGADSGIAILATGEVPEDTVNMTPAIQPKLRVDLNLGGRRWRRPSGTTGSSTTGARPPSRSTERFCMMGQRVSLAVLRQMEPGTSG